MFVFLIIYFELIFLLCFKLAACKRPKNDEHSPALSSSPTLPLLRSSPPRAPRSEPQRRDTCWVRPRPTTDHAPPPRPAPSGRSPPRAGRCSPRRRRRVGCNGRRAPHAAPRAPGPRNKRAAPPPRARRRHVGSAARTDATRSAAHARPPSRRPPHRRPPGAPSGPQPPPAASTAPRGPSADGGEPRGGRRAGPGPLPKRKVCGRSGPMLSMSMALSSIFSACSRGRSCTGCGAADGRALKEAPRPPPPRYSPRVLARSSGRTRPRCPPTAHAPRLPFPPRAPAWRVVSAALGARG